MAESSVGKNTASPVGGIMESRSKLVRNRVESWILFVLLIGVITSAIFEHVIGGRPDYAEKFGPSWLAFVAAGIATFGIRIV